jgi:hypothetical protein
VLGFRGREYFVVIRVVGYAWMRREVWWRKVFWSVKYGIFGEISKCKPDMGIPELPLEEEMGVLKVTTCIIPDGEC